VAAAGLALLAIALRRLTVRSNIFFTPRNLHTFRLPQGESVYGSGRPMTAGIAMTISHTCGLSGHRELDSPTKTTSIVRLWTVHNASPQPTIRGSSTKSSYDTAPQLARFPGERTPSRTL
jgi:hypothetical protein